jgi:hypothetical protein
MNIQLTRLYAILVGALGVLGLFVSGHLFGITNSDWAMDILRIGLAVYLVWAGFISKADRAADSALYVVGGLYVIMGVIGLFSPTLGGILPTGLTGFDVVFHLITGGLAIGVADADSRRHRHVAA